MTAAPQMFASMFTMSVFLIFGYCLTTICYFAYDPDSRFFIGRWPLWGLLWVPFFGFAHWYHLKKQRPVRSIMMACIFGAATTYFIIGWVVLHSATRLHTVLRSSDCSRTSEFKEFNEAALAARAFHNKCLAESKEALLIHYCPGYEDEKAQDNRAQTWEYLKYAEHNYGCAGFCNVAGDPSMWTYQGYQDSCASATANVMKSKIAALAFQMMVYSIIIVVMFLLWIEIMGPTLKAIERQEPMTERRKEEKAPPPLQSLSYQPPAAPPQPAWGSMTSLPPPTTSLPPQVTMGPSTFSMGPPDELPAPAMPPPSSVTMGPPMGSYPPPATQMGPPPSITTSLPPPVTQVGAPSSMTMGPPQGWTVVDSMPAQGSMPPRGSMPPSMPPPAFTSSRLD